MSTDNLWSQRAKKLLETIFANEPTARNSQEYDKRNPNSKPNTEQATRTVTKVKTYSNPGLERTVRTIVSDVIRGLSNFGEFYLNDAMKHVERHLRYLGLPRYESLEQKVSFHLQTEAEQGHLDPVYKGESIIFVPRPQLISRK